MNEHAQAIKHKAETIALTIEHIKERYGLSDYIVQKVRAEMDLIAGDADALAAQVDRLQSLVTAEAALSTALVDLLTDEQVSRPDYPTDLDREATRLGRICHEHGDLPDEEG